MAPSLSSPDVVIVGAGAAGLAAAVTLRPAGRACLIIEARERAGGRAWTTSIGDGQRVDLGCEWLHSADRNALAALALAKGVDLDRSAPPWRQRRAQPSFDLAAQDSFAEARNAFFGRLATAAQSAEKQGGDAAASDFLVPGCRWNALLGAVSTYYSGAPLERISIRDLERYEDTETDWRIVGGYGAFIRSFATGLAVEHDCAVTRISSSGVRLRVETTRGDLDAGSVIVTVPTDVLAAGSIRFDGEVDDHLHAAAGLPLGLADKLYFGLPDAVAFEPDTRLIGAIDRVDTGSYTIRPGGRPLVEGYFGGDHARELERGGLAAFAAVARSEIASHLGAEFAARLTPLAATAWASDPFARGSYSYAKPGCAEARGRLAMPIDERLFFAGEATSPNFFSTAHGAWEEGVRAARALIEADRAAVAAAHP